MSIKFQFMCYLIGFTIQAIYMICIICVPRATFVGECAKTIVLIISFVAPVFMIMLVHYETFSNIVNQKNRGESQLIDSNPLATSDQTSRLDSQSRNESSETLMSDGIHKSKLM